MQENCVEKSIEYLSTIEGVTIDKKSSCSLWFEYRGLKMKFYFKNQGRTVNFVQSYSSITLHAFTNKKEFLSSREVLENNLENLIDKVLNYDLRAYLE